MTTTRHFLHVFPTFCAAGPQVRATALMRGFGAGYRHSVVALDGRAEAAALAPPADLQILRVTARRGPVATFRALRALLRRQQPDLLLTYNWGAMDAVMAARSLGWHHLVHHEDGFNPDEVQKLKRRRNWTRRSFLRQTSVIVPSQRLEQIARNAWGLRHVRLVPNGIDALAFEPNEADRVRFRGELGIPPAAIVIGAVGHLRAVKNLGRLVRAVAMVAGDSPLHLVIAGDGTEREALVALAGTLTISVHFTGHIVDLRPAYSAFDLFALSSDSEQQPVALLEAMAAGLPVCATDVGDIRRTLPRSGHDFVVPLGARVESELAAVVARLVKDESLRRQLGGDNQRHVREHYSERAMCEAYLAVYQAAQRPH